MLNSFRMRANSIARFNPECNCKMQIRTMYSCIHSATHLGDFDKIQQEGQGFTFPFKMYTDCDECTMVGRRPRISCERQLSPVVLECVLSELNSGIDHATRTWSSFAIRPRTLANTRLTSRETVEGSGKYWVGRPVFISFLNPRSLTIEKGRLLSATQRTISALQVVLLIAKKPSIHTTHFVCVRVSCR
jgi:hypothetical protein